VGKKHARIPVGWRYVAKMAVDLRTGGTLTLDNCASGALRTLRYIAHRIEFN
jgi:hypothetical protein